jgi:putative NADH-flavin reductase
MTQEVNAVTVFGGSGRLGRHVVAELLRRGTNVRALVHRNNPFDWQERLTTVAGDVHDARVVASAIVGVDTVIATLGSADAPVKDVSSAAMRHLIPSILSRGIRRIISVTGSGARDYVDIGNEHPFLRARREWMMRQNPELLIDGERHMLMLRNSGLDWTVVRATRMSEGMASACRLVTEPPPPSSVLPYRAVALAIVDQIAVRTWWHRAPFASL